MSAPRNASATAHSTANETSQKVGTAAVAKASNPARPSKFAGLNLRQRSTEQPAEEAEPVPLSRTSPDQDRERQATSTHAEPDREPDARNPGAVDLRGKVGVAVPPDAQIPAAPQIQAEQTVKRDQTRQQSATSQLLATSQRTEQVLAETATTEQGPMRRRGKRTDPEYVQVTAYVRQETYRRARIKLLESTKPQEFSEIVEELLTLWLRACS